MLAVSGGPPERGQPAPTSAFSNRTASREKEFASTQPNVRNDHILIVPDVSCSCRHQAVCPASRSSGHKVRVLRSSFPIWSRWITVQLELRQHSSLRVTMSGSGTQRTAARLASIGERADVRFTSLSFLIHATMDLHSQHTISPGPGDDERDAAYVVPRDGPRQGVRGGHGRRARGDGDRPRPSCAAPTRPGGTGRAPRSGCSA